MVQRNALAEHSVAAAPYPQIITAAYIDKKGPKPFLYLNP
jgi:hypothetical protein